MCNHMYSHSLHVLTATCVPVALRVHRFPGHRTYHDTVTLQGTSPVFSDAQTWSLARTSDVDTDLRTRTMQFVVFDEATTNRYAGLIPLH